MDTDPTTTNPEFYRTLWENDDVRVLEYRDVPGQETTPHEHPNTVMITLTDFDRRLSSGGGSRDVTLPAGAAVWLPAQSHSGRNTGSTPTHTILVELKHSTAADRPASLGPEI
ncbi:MAG: cytoplasmic protein [Actinobacteria bacterium]|nr:cytoplasmic protein [Actinomycetota bacterium]